MSVYFVCVSILDVSVYVCVSSWWWHCQTLPDQTTWRWRFLHRTPSDLHNDLKSCWPLHLRRRRSLCQSEETLLSGLFFTFNFSLHFFTFLNISFPFFTFLYHSFFFTFLYLYLNSLSLLRFFTLLLTILFTAVYYYYDYYDDYYYYY